MNLKSITLPELSALLKELGQPAFRAKQVYTWLHKGVRSYDEMTNLPKSLRDVLAEQYPIQPPKVVRRQESARDGGNGAHALSLRQHRLHFHPGGLSHGLCLLRLHHWRPGASAGAL